MTGAKTGAPKRTGGAGQRRRKPLLAKDVTHVDYKDVALLRTFLSDRGKIRARRVTGVSPQQQRAVTKAVKIAREIALLPYAGHASSGPSNPRANKEAS